MLLTYFPLIQSTAQYKCTAPLHMTVSLSCLDHMHSVRTARPLPRGRTRPWSNAGRALLANMGLPGLACYGGAAR